MFRKKVKGIEPILDGIRQIQLYECPSCGRKVEKKSFTKCAVCGISLCGDDIGYDNHCSRIIELDYRQHDFSKHKIYLCLKHYGRLERMIKKLIRIESKSKLNTSMTKEVKDDRRKINKAQG